ncbi:hypothetical protein ROZALSC1DRAFT_26461 [Rozella allomycis CSF55]|uniref:Uncharacterized protein n=1 Tax=Rozella allomycis (strain CSF55) TaxID=988480 RepID=A0A075AP24_ROZAC|nr:hypothetical protein O9G_000226 [Rozella allomycis CSF55]RKP22165.1 hypothetical protein ROZALSC1DRAFT_26461 [Rozella allomycis CSF55]|eukprot:EPZ31747.1 hypothetical protein O9G_000226 [Rozella allomycis CSF55]
MRGSQLDLGNKLINLLHPVETRDQDVTQEFVVERSVRVITNTLNAFLPSERVIHEYKTFAGSMKMISKSVHLMDQLESICEKALEKINTGDCCNETFINSFNNERKEGRLEMNTTNFLSLPQFNNQEIISGKDEISLQLNSQDLSYLLETFMTKKLDKGSEYLHPKNYRPLKFIIYYSEQKKIEVDVNKVRR